MANVNIPKIKDTDKAEAATFNKPLEVIESELNGIFDRLDIITNKEAVLVSGVFIDSSVELGDIVYMGHDGLMYPAICALDQTYDTNGASIESPQSRALGMIVDIKGSIATMIVGGRYKSAACVLNCIGESPESGVYYLSSETAGKVTNKANRALKQPVLVYMGDDTICLPLLYQAQNTHFHAGYTINPGYWSPVSPDRAVYTGDYGNIGVSNITEGVTAIFHNGLLSDEFDIEGGKLYANMAASAIGKVTLFTAVPASFSSGVIRDVVAGNNSVHVHKSNGIAEISVSEFDVDSHGKYPVAVSAIHNGTVDTTSVVSGITTHGDNISCTYNNSTGEVTIYDNGHYGSRIQANEYNLNGAKTVSDDLFTYTVLPGSRKSSVTISRDIIKSTNSEDKLKVWVDIAKDINPTNINVELYFTEFPSDGSPTQLASLAYPIKITTINVHSLDGMLTHCVSDDYGIVRGSGIVSAKISADSPGIDVYILRAGFCIVHEA